METKTETVKTYTEAIKSNMNNYLICLKIDDRFYQEYFEAYSDLHMMKIALTVIKKAFKKEYKKAKNKIISYKITREYRDGETLVKSRVVKDY